MKCTRLKLVGTAFFAVLLVLAFTGSVGAASWHGVEVWSIHANTPSPTTTYTLTILSDPALGGTTTPVAGKYQIDSGTTVTITPNPNTDYTFRFWWINASYTNTMNPLIFSITGNTVVLPVFTLTGTFHDVETWSIGVSTYTTVYYEFNVTDLLTGFPIVGATVTIMGYLPVWYQTSNTTDVNGISFLPSPATETIASWQVSCANYYTQSGGSPSAYMEVALGPSSPTASWHGVETWVINSTTYTNWHDVENWTITTGSYPYTYTFLGVFDEQSGTLTSQTMDITVYSTFGTPYNITLAPGTNNVTIFSLYMPSSFRFYLPNNYSRYYYPRLSTETIYVFYPASPFYTYYVNIAATVGLSNAYVESYVYLNGTSFTVERWPYSSNNKIPFVLTQFASYGFRLICDQGTTDFGRHIPGDPSIVPQFTFSVGPMDFATAPLTYGNLTLTVTRLNNSWIQIMYFDNGNQTVSVTVTIAEPSGYGQWQTIYTNTQLTMQTYYLDYLDAEQAKDYVVTVTVVHSVYGTLAWQYPLPSMYFNTNPFVGLSVFGSFPFDVSQFIGFFIAACVFGLFSARDHPIGLIIAIAVVGLLASPPIHWLGIPMTTVVIFLCFAILYGLGRRKPT